MVHSLRFTFVFYVMTTFFGNLFHGCDPAPPSAIEDYDASVLPPITQFRFDLDPQVEDAEIDLPGPLLNSVLPNRSPLSGGIRIRIIGEDFRAPMYVRIGEQPCVTLNIESQSRMSCVVPAVAQPQVVDIEITWGPIPSQGSILDESPNAYEGSLRVLSEVFNYFEPLTVENISPNKGPRSGQSLVTLTGTGFSESTDVRFGSVPALSTTFEDTQTLKVMTPSHPPGLVDITIRDPAGSVVLEEAYTFQVPLGLNELSPRWGLVSGGEPIQFYGYGLTQESTIELAQQSVSIEEINPPSRVSGLTPTVSQAGWVDLSIQNLNGQYIEEQAFLYLDDQVGPFQVFGAIPQRLPSDLGGRFMIGGNGFNESVRVTLDRTELNCSLESAQRLSCFAPRHAPGEVEITVWRELVNQKFRLSFYKPLEFYFTTPDRAAQSGGALIRVRGRGLSPNSLFWFGDQRASIERFISDEELWLKAPPHPPARLDITVREAGQEVYIPESFTYFDPMALYGGSWGERIEHAINVTVLNIYDFSPLPDVTIEARRFDQPNAPPLLVGLSNQEGQVTLSSETLAAPLHMNIVKSGFEAQTVERVVSENLTVLLFPFTPPEGEGEPPPPPEPVTIRGTLSGLNELEKPPEAGMVLRAFVDVSHSGMMNRASSSAPAPLGVLSEDGPFELITRPGQMALIATAAYVPADDFARYERGEMSYWFMRKLSYPIQMGLIRFLSLSPGSEISQLNLNLTYPLAERADVKLLNPPSGAGTIYTDSFGEIMSVQDQFEVRAFLDLEADGYWELDIQGQSDLPNLSLSALPKLSEWSDAPQLLWFASSQVHPNGVNSYSEHQQSDLNRRVEIGPFVDAAKLIERSSGDSISTGETLRWTPWPGVEGRATDPPQATSIRFYQAGLPVWGFTLPGGVNELTLPPLPLNAAGGGASPGSIYVSIEPMLSAQGLDYQDYNLLDLNSATSYSTTRFELMYDP